MCIYAWLHSILMFASESIFLFEADNWKAYVLIRHLLKENLSFKKSIRISPQQIYTYNFIQFFKYLLKNLLHILINKQIKEFIGRLLLLTKKNYDHLHSVCQNGLVLETRTKFVAFQWKRQPWNEEKLLWRKTRKKQARNRISNFMMSYFMTRSICTNHVSCIRWSLSNVWFSLFSSSFFPFFEDYLIHIEKELSMKSKYQNSFRTLVTQCSTTIHGYR